MEKTTQRLVKSVPIDPHDTHEVTVASIRLDRLTQGEVLAVEGRTVSSIGHLPYNALTQGQIVISEKRASSNNLGIPLSVATRNGAVTAEERVQLHAGTERLHDAMRAGEERIRPHPCQLP